MVQLMQRHMGYNLYQSFPSLKLVLSVQWQSLPVCVESVDGGGWRKQPVVQNLYVSLFRQFVWNVEELALLSRTRDAEPEGGTESATCEELSQGSPTVQRRRSACPPHPGAPFPIRDEHSDVAVHYTGQFLHGEGRDLLKGSEGFAGLPTKKRHK